MSHLSVYLSPTREKWIKSELGRISAEKDRSVSYIVEEALLQYIHSEGGVMPGESGEEKKRAKR